jgi:peroxiredoxin
MRRLSAWTIGVYVALVLAIGIVVLLARAQRELETRYERLAERSAWLHPGSYVPPVPTSTLTGDTLILGAPPAGARQVLLVFTTTCPYCRASVPAWRSLAARAHSLSRLGGVAPHVVGLSLDSLPATTHYMDEHGLRFPVTQFPTRRDQALYRARSVPLILVIDADNRVAYSRMGVPTSLAALDSVWRAAIGEFPPRSATPPARTAAR